MRLAAYRVDPQYNGNIATQQWGSGLANKFLYSYDKVNRLTNGTSTGIAMSEVIDYDVMGNINTFSRDGGAARLYVYTGNRLNHVEWVTNAYFYDGNGNATTDGRNGTTLSYNYLNLPATVTKTTPALSITYTYDANGRKLKKVNNTTATTRQYIEGIEYKGSTIDFIHTEEGIARNTSGVYSYEYHLRDHLGNVRYTFNKNATTGLLTKLQEDNYYPFGKQKSVVTGLNKYLYNSKELQTELGQLDYGARFYDPEIGRWNVIDPLAEKMRRYSSYAFVYNNPLRFVDPDGMEGTDWVLYSTDLGSYARWDDNVTDQASATARYGSSALYAGKQANYTSVDGYSILLNSDKTWQYNAPLLGPSSTGPSLSESIQQRMPVLNLAEGIATVSAIAASGGLGAAESGTSYLLGQAARKSEFMTGLANYSFSTGRNIAATLTEQLSMAEITANPTMGTVVKSLGTMKDTRWFGWNKMQYSHKALDGSKTTIHYVGKFADDVLKAVDDFKFK
ncbi:RHS repeat-associated core domain-containing protein [Pedobacter psychroterrae]|nr:RHS repeat-associated core domain-containing protein [Pedobacter psychroterrae]